MSTREQLFTRRSVTTTLVILVVFAVFLLVRGVLALGNPVDESPTSEPTSAPVVETPTAEPTISPNFDLKIVALAYDENGEVLPGQSISVILAYLEPGDARVLGWKDEEEFLMEPIYLEIGPAPFYTATEAHSYTLMIEPWQVSREASSQTVTIECVGTLDGATIEVEQFVDEYGATNCTASRDS